MNKVILIGRLTKDPVTSYTQDGKGVTRFTLAVDRRFRREGNQEADFINCVAFGRQSEFSEKYLKQGIKIAVTGRIQTGSYTNREGKKVYTTDVVAEELEFVESKKQEQIPSPQEQPPKKDDGFITIPDDAEELPFV